MKIKTLSVFILSALLSVSAFADSKHSKKEEHRGHESSKEVQAATVYSKLTFQSDKGEVVLLSDNNFKSAEMTGPGQFSQVVSEPVPGDGRPIPASGMLLSNTNGYSINTGSDNTGILTLPRETIKLKDASLTKEIYFKTKKGEILTLVSHSPNFENAVLKYPDGKFWTLEAAPTRMAGVTLENTKNHIKLHFILESKLATLSEGHNSQELEFTKK